jgi:hypothetical protein
MTCPHAAALQRCERHVWLARHAHMRPGMQMGAAAAMAVAAALAAASPAAAGATQPTVAMVRPSDRKPQPFKNA